MSEATDHKAAIHKALMRTPGPREHKFSSHLPSNTNFLSIMDYARIHYLQASPKSGNYRFREGKFYFDVGQLTIDKKLFKRLLESESFLSTISDSSETRKNISQFTW